MPQRPLLAGWFDFLGQWMKLLSLMAVIPVRHTSGRSMALPRGIDGLTTSLAEDTTMELDHTA
jgi:hypothetical protein